MEIANDPKLSYREAVRCGAWLGRSFVGREGYL